MISSVALYSRLKAAWQGSHDDDNDALRPASCLSTWVLFAALECDPSPEQFWKWLSFFISRPTIAAWDFFWLWLHFMVMEQSAAATATGTRWSIPCSRLLWILKYAKHIHVRCTYSRSWLVSWYLIYVFNFKLGKTQLHFECDSVCFCELFEGDEKMSYS